jgi:hypothetical protein
MDLSLYRPWDSPSRFSSLRLAAARPAPAALCGTRLVAGLALSVLEGQVAWGGRQGVGVPPSVEKAV